MYIHEAVKELTVKKPYITRKSWARWSRELHGGIKLQPTNSPDGCIIESDVDKKNRRSWNPTAEDLAADDWIAVGL